MANSSCGTEPDRKIPLNAAEQEVVSHPGKIQADVESADVHGSSSDTAIIVHLPEVKLTNISTAETEEQDTDIKNNPQSQRDLDNPIIYLCGNLDEVANETKSTPSPKPQTSQKDEKTPNPSQEPFLHLYSKDTLFPIDKSRMDPKAIDEPPERFPDTVLELVEETCVCGEIQLQVTDEDETLEPPARKRLRKRMGMCGLGDKKKKFLFDKQHCRQGLLGINRRDKCNNAAQYLHKDGDMTLMDHEGTSGPACDENDEEVLVLEANSAAVMDDGRKEEVDRENRYALSKCSALVSVRVTTDESPKENQDVLKKATLDDNNGTIITDETDEQVAGTVPKPPGSTIGKSLKIIQEEWSVAAASSDQDIETTICSEEPHFSGLEITNIEQDLEFSIKHEVLTDKQNNHANTKMDENRGKIATEVDVAQDVSCSLIRMTVETSEGSVVATKVGIQAVHKEIEDEHSPSLASSEKHDPNGPELCRPSKRESYPSHFNNTSILAVASIYKTQRGENKKSIIAVLDSKEPAVEDAEDVKEISGPVAPPTGQENCIQHFIDQNACNTSVTPTVAEQQVCNSTLTPAASELPEETDVRVSPWLYSLTDSQIHKIALSMELEDQPVSESCAQPEDATELVRGLIRELSSLNRTVMVAQREMELVHRGKITKAPKRLCGPRNTERSLCGAGERSPGRYTGSHWKGCKRYTGKYFLNY